MGSIITGGTMTNCACGSEISYEDCCKKLHLGDQIAQTAEQLMRSRYSAFANNQIKYIANTHIPGTADFDEDEARDWAVNSTWKGLEIIKTQKGASEDKDGIVEFKAFYDDKNGNSLVHHEIASFKKESDKWYYVDGQIVGAAPLKRSTPKVGRNEPCICGSGKKYKKCCGK